MASATPHDTVTMYGPTDTPNDPPSEEGKGVEEGDAVDEGVVVLEGEVVLDAEASEVGARSSS